MFPKFGLTYIAIHMWLCVIFISIILFYLHIRTYASYYAVACIDLISYNLYFSNFSLHELCLSYPILIMYSDFAKIITV